MKKNREEKISLKNRRKEITILIISIVILVISICIFPPIIYFVIIGWFIYEYFYFKSDKFLKIKNSIKENTKKCNELNAHIEDLKRAYINIKQIDYGQANYIDNSKYNYKRPELKRIKENNCSNTFVRNNSSTSRRQFSIYIMNTFFLQNVI